MTLDRRYLIPLALISGAVASACGGSTDSGAPASSSTIAPATTTMPAPVATTTTTNVASAPAARAQQPLPSSCEPAPDQYVSIIDAAFSNSSETLGDTFSVQGPNDLLYLGANIMEGGTKVSSADVWVAQGPTVYSLSGDARRRTTLGDGRVVFNISAGDDLGSAVQDCVTTAERNRNAAGG